MPSILTPHPEMCCWYTFSLMMIFLVVCFSVVPDKFYSAKDLALILRCVVGTRFHG
jgi:hypothetical protein